LNIQSSNIVFSIGFITYIIIRGIFEQRTKENVKAVIRVDWRDRIVLVIVFLGSLLLPFVYLFTPWLEFADYDLPTFVPWMGAA